MKNDTVENYLKNELYDLFKKDDRIFDFIQDGSLDGLWYWDLENPENEWMSSKFWTTLGYNPSEMPHSPESWQNIINQDDLKIAVEMVNEHLSNPENLYDQIVRYKHKNGSMVWIRCRGMAIRDNNGKPIRMIGAHQDITLQKRAEEDILSKIKIFEKINEYTIEISSLNYDELFPRISKRIKEFFEVEEVVISLYDEKNSEIITKYTTFSDEDNNKLSKYLGGKIIGLRSPITKEGYDILVSRTMSKVDSLHEITFGKIPDTIGKMIEKVYGIGWFIGIALMQNNNLVGTIVLVGKKGKEVPDETLLETFIKITTTELSRKIAELELIGSEERYRSLLTNLETGVVVHNQDTSIVLSNERASELLGLSIEQMKGKEAIDPYWKFIYEDNTPVPLNDYPVMRILNSKEAIQNQVYGVCRKSDDVVWLMVNGFPNLINNEISEIIVSFNDITSVRLANQELLKAKYEIEESEQRFKALHNASFGGIVIHDKGMILDCNQGLSEMTGYSLNELIGMNGLLLIAPQDRDFVINQIAIAYEKPYEAMGLRKNGEQFPMRLEARNIPYKGKQVRTVEFRDLTDQKVAENELLLAKEKAEENEQMFKSLIENAPDGVVIVDINGIIKYGSPNAARHFGYQEEDVLGHSGSEFTHPDDIPMVLKAFESMIIDPSLKPKLKYRFRRKNGEYRWIETTFTNLLSNKYINGFILNFSDITERKYAEDALKSSEAKLSALFSSMSEMVVMHELVLDSLGNPINYRITDCNYAFTNSTGITKEMAVGNLATDVYNTQRAPYLEEYSKVAITGLPMQYETYYQPMDKYFLISVVSQGENQFATITTDISEIKRAEILIQDKSEEIATQNEELNLANQELQSAISRAEHNEANVTAIIEGTQNSIWAFDRKYDILYINQVFKNEFYLTFGVELEKGSNLITCLPEILRPFWKPRYDRVLNNEQFTVEDVLETEFGNIYIQVTFNPIIKNGEVIGGSCFGSNITERKQAEKEILQAKEKAEESEMQFRNLFENASDAIFIAEEESGIIIDVNHAAEKLMLMDKNEIIGMHQSQLHPPELDEFSKESFKKHVKKPLNDRTPLFIENDLVRKDGTKVPVEVLANKLMYKGKNCLVGTFRDITERRNAELEIIKAKEKIERHAIELNKVQSITHVGSWYLDLETNEVVWTEELYKMYGFDPNLPPPPYTEHKKLFVPESWEILSTSLAKTRETGIPYELELKTVRKDKSNGWMWVRGDALFDKNNQIVGLWGAAQDITERKSIEEQLRVAKEKAEESDRLKSAFLANMSHEIRTPMNGILGFAQLLKEPDLSGDEQLEFISIIEKSGKRMLNIINDIIDISKIEAGLMKLNLQESNINDQIEYIHSFFHPEANYKKIKLTYGKQLPDQLAIINTDKEKIFAIFTNLVKNAIKFTDKGSIEFGYTLKSENNSKYLLFYVKDTGIGIPKSRQDAIFERFIQADITDSKAYQGAGLGLAITKAYVEMLGGKIWVESEQNVGSIFYFTHPYDTILRTELNVLDNHDLEKFDIMDGLKILIAEDDTTSQTLLKKFLKSDKIEILTVNSGLKAVELCRSHIDIDIILMDIQLPELNGYVATKQIREFNKDIIIIAQTAYGLTGDHEKALESGCNDYIKKPIDKKELLTKIELHINKKS